MKTIYFFVCFILTALFMVACDRTEPELSEDKLVNTIYQSIDGTPEQFNARITQLGFREVSKSSKGMTFSNVYSDYDDQILLNIAFNENRINKIVYEKFLNKESNLSAYYKRFSDMIAEYGCSGWQGYYKDPATNKDIGNILWLNDYSSSSKVETRQELYNAINNDNLLELNSLQFFLEIFTYTHSDMSQWGGQIFLYTNQYFSGLNEGDGKDIKDIRLSFCLKRIE